MNVVFQCDKCGKCCKGKLAIYLKIKDIKGLKKRGYETDSFTEVKNGIARLKKVKNQCSFLDKDNLCLIQKKYGFNEKPEVCRNFPYNEFVCGAYNFNKRKNVEIKRKSEVDLLFQLNNKAITPEVFIYLIKQLDYKRDIYLSYSNLLFNILNQKESIIFDKFKIKDYPIKNSKRMENFFKEILSENSGDFLFRLKRFFNKPISLNFPTRKFMFDFKKAEIPEKVLKEFIPYLEKQILLNKRFNDYPIKLLFFLYFLPYFTNLTSKEEKINLLHVIEAFSLLNSLNRFESIRLLRLDKVDKNLNKLILKNN